MRARRTLLAFTALSLAAFVSAPALANSAWSPSGYSVGVTASETRSLTLAPNESLDQVLRRLGIDAAERKAALAALKETGVTPAAGAKLSIRTEIPRPGSQTLAMLRVGAPKSPEALLVATPEADLDAPLRRSVRGTVGPDFPAFLKSIGVPERVAETVADGFPAGQPAPGARFSLVYQLTADKSDAQFVSLSVNGPSGEQRLAAFPVRRALEVGVADAPPPARERGTERAQPARAETVVEGIPTGDPVPGGRLTSPWGWRIHPVLKRPQFHKGVDYSAPAGTPVLATAPGTVTYVGRNGNYGKLVRITHEGEVVTGYAHLQGYAKTLKVGAKVSQGQVIGYVGRSGLATGNHLYYEVFARGKLVDPLGGSASPSRHMTEAENQRLQRALAKKGIVLAGDGVALD